MDGDVSAECMAAGIPPLDLSKALGDTFFATEGKENDEDNELFLSDSSQLECADER